MKHIFLINPAAGKVDRHAEFEAAINEYFRDSEENYEIILTKRPGHATEIVENVCTQNPSGVRIYVFGGDGTFNEAVQSAYRYPNCALGLYPSGSGNDLIKSITGSRTPELVLSDLIKGGVIKTDLIKCGDMVGANLCSLGFDAEVAQTVNKYKKSMNGALAYDLAVIRCLVNHFGYDFECVIDDKEVVKGTFLFVIAANGGYYGSNFHPAPAILNDGLLDFVFVNKVSRPKFIRILGEYKSGTYLRRKDVARHVRGRKLTVRGPEGLSANIDGEVFPVNEITFEVMKNALNLIIPLNTKSDNLVNMTIEFAAQ